MHGSFSRIAMRIVSFSALEVPLRVRVEEVEFVVDMKGLDALVHTDFDDFR